MAVTLPPLTTVPLRDAILQRTPFPPPNNKPLVLPPPEPPPPSRQDDFPPSSLAHDLLHPTTPTVTYVRWEDVPAYPPLPPSLLDYVTHLIGSPCVCGINDTDATSITIVLPGILARLLMAARMFVSLGTSISWLIWLISRRWLSPSRSMGPHHRVTILSQNGVFCHLHCPMA